MKLSTGMITLGAGLFLANRMKIIDVSGLFHRKRFPDEADTIDCIHRAVFAGVKFFLPLSVFV